MWSVKQGSIKYHFWVFGMTETGIEPRFSGPLTNTQLWTQKSLCSLHKSLFLITVCVDDAAFWRLKCCCLFREYPPPQQRSSPSWFSHFWGLLETKKKGPVVVWTRIDWTVKTNEKSWFLLEHTSTASETERGKYTNEYPYTWSE